MTSLQTILDDHRRQLIKAERQVSSDRKQVGIPVEVEMVNSQLEDNMDSFYEACPPGYGRWGTGPITKLLVCECGHAQIYHKDGFDKDDARHTDGACNHMECGCREYKQECEGGPCPRCEWEEGRSLADRQYHEENCI